MPARTKKAFIIVVLDNNIECYYNPADGLAYKEFKEHYASICLDTTKLELKKCSEKFGMSRIEPIFVKW